MRAVLLTALAGVAAAQWTPPQFVDGDHALPWGPAAWRERPATRLDAARARLDRLHAELQQAREEVAQLESLQSPLVPFSLAADSSPCPYTWTRDLSVGSTGNDVLALQRFLNRDSATRVASSGAGSPGMETTYYGPATADAVSRFQVKYRSEILSPVGLSSPTGNFASRSRSKANALCGGSSSGGGGGGSTSGGSVSSQRGACQRVQSHDGARCYSLVLSPPST